jgi:uncharacterized protein (DUF2141 family)
MSRFVAAQAAAWTVLLGLLFAARVPAQSAAETIVVEVSGLRSDRGVVLGALYDSPDGWAEEGHEIATCGARVVRGRATCTIHGVAAGSYALALLHDENENGRLDRDFIGWPQEGFGFSSGAGPSLAGAPSFESASFDHDGAATTIRIRARYGL